MLDARFSGLSQKYIQQLFDFHPEWAVSLGLHETYDGRSTAYDIRTIRREITFHKQFLKSLSKIPATRLSRENYFDYKIIRTGAESLLWKLETLGEYRANPMMYIASLDVSGYIKRNYAPLSERLNSLINTQKSFPSIVAAAKRNLNKRLPVYAVETAMEMLDGTIKFLRTDLPPVVRRTDDKKLIAAFEKSNKKAIQAVDDYLKFLNKILPDSHEGFAIGQNVFTKMLKSCEGLSLPISSLLERAWEELYRTKAELLDTARAIAPDKSIIEIERELKTHHAAEKTLVGDTASMLEEMLAFVKSKHLVTVPESLDLRVELTPKFLRWAFAMIDTPGAFDYLDTAFYYVTPAEDHWTDEQKNQWYQFFDHYTLRDISVHEAYPGHYIHFLKIKNECPSAIAKIFTTYTFIEGWAHYSEQLMVEAGYWAHDPRYYFAYLKESLIRIVRLIVAVKMHTMDMSVDDATFYFMRHAYMEEGPARKEAVRGTFDPGYGNYTLGKLMMLKLRDDYRTTMGQNFNLQSFHDQLLSYGAPPIPVMREILLGEEGSVL